MANQVQNFRMEDSTSNPAPLGLMGFGMTTVLLNLHNAGVFQLSSMILAMGIFYGGFAQVIAGIMEWKKGNTFGTTAFTSYGLFWLSLAGLILLPKMNIASAPESIAMGSYLAMWGIFTTVMFFRIPPSIWTAVLFPCPIMITPWKYPHRTVFISAVPYILRPGRNLSNPPWTIRSL